MEGCMHCCGDPRISVSPPPALRWAAPPPPASRLAGRERLLTWTAPWDESVTLLFGELQATADSRLHLHAELQIGIVVDRPVRLRAFGRRRLLPPGTVFAALPHELHAVEPAAMRGARVHSLYVESDLLARLVPDADLSLLLATPPAHRVRADARLASRLIGAIRSFVAPEAEGPGPDDLVPLGQLLGRLLVGPGGVQAPERDALARVRELVMARFAERITLDDMADAAGLSRFHLSRTFRDAYGLPPHAYLTQVRLAEVRRRLVRGESASQAAYACGFADQSHMSRQFKRIFGIRPGAFVRGIVRTGASAEVLAGV